MLLVICRAPRANHRFQKETHATENSTTPTIPCRSDELVTLLALRSSLTAALGTWAPRLTTM
jgi:hypothetical protein